MRCLFVCSAGVKRSPMAADVSRELAERYKIQDYQADYFGIDGITISEFIFSKYDRVFAMDGEIAKILRKYILESKLIKLNVSDQHSVSERRFRELLKKDITEQLEPYFRELAGEVK